MYLLYSITLGILALVALPYWLFKGIRERKYFSNLWHRLGLSLTKEASGPKPVWIHAVSVGEVLAAKPLVHALQAVRPDLPLVVSTVTLTGQAVARKEFASPAMVLYFPFDWDFSVNRFLRLIRPRAVVLLETELWPNFLRNCARQAVPVLLANGRISDRSFPRYHRFLWITRAMIRNLARIGAQTVKDAQRFLQLGAGSDQVTVTGNMKFDLPVPPVKEDDPVLQLVRSRLRLEPGTPVIVIGSSMKGEESLFIDCYRQVRHAIPTAKLVLAPRHPERFDEVAKMVSGSGFSYDRRSRPGTALPLAADVLVLDSIGELRRIYSLASIAVIGGSFLPFGGHNPLEPAGLGKAIIFGPEMRNFREIASLFLERGAARQCSLHSLAEVVVELLDDKSIQSGLGERALEVFKQNQGATENTLRLLLPYLD